MELNPILTLTFALIFVACTVTILIIQIIAYRWAQKLEGEFAVDAKTGKHEEGWLLVNIVRRFLRLLVIAQVMGSSIVLLYVFFPDAQLARATLVVSAQILTVVASVLLLRRVSKLRDEIIVEEESATT